MLYGGSARIADCSFFHMRSTNMKRQIALAVALALGSTLAMAAGDKDKAGTSTGSSATGAGTSAGSPPETVGTPVGTGGAASGMTPEAFWSKHAKEGSLSREDAMKYKTPEGKSVEFDRLDTNKDGKVSQSEWNAYHGATGAAGRTGGDTPRGTSGAGGADKPAGTTGSGSSGTTR
jgi:hypothetical protein